MPFFYLQIISINLHAQSVGGTLSGGTQLCPNSPNSGFLMLSGHTGSILYWESTTDGGVTWNNIGNPIASYSYSSLTQTTCYRVIVKSGSFPPDTSTVACITIFAPSVGGVVSGGSIFCSSAPGDTLVLTGNTGNVVNWQYSVNGGASWTNVANTTTSLVYPAITQNTLYRAIVQNGTGCPVDTSGEDSIMIDPVTVPGSITGSTSVCYLTNNDTLVLSGNTGNILSWMYSTDSGTSWTSVSNTTASQSFSGLTQTTWYAVVVKSGICPTDTSLPAVINVFPLIAVNAGKDTAIIKGKSVTLNGSGAGKPVWSPSVGITTDTVFNPVATPSITTTYILTVTDTNGCTNSDTVLITVIPGEFSEVITTLFTPNGDGINDTWYIQDMAEFPDNEVTVYNIYGNEVYSAKGYMNDWDGTYKGAALPDGTYYYIVKLNKTSQIFKGSVDIVRSK